MSDFEITFLGTNGSCSFDNGKRSRIGTNTPCAAVKAGNSTLIFDAGSGICGFGGLTDYQNERINLFFSHCHLDHLNGLLFFPYFFDASKKIDLYGGKCGEVGFSDIIESFLSPPFNPVGLNAFTADVNIHTVELGEDVILSEEVVVKTFGISHPNGELGFRVEYGGKSLCYCSDIELSDHRKNGGLYNFTKGADLLVMDSFFDENEVIKGWGHSSWRESAEWAQLCGAKSLALFHYKFMLTDEDISVMEKKAQAVFPNTFASADRMRVEL